MPASERSWTPQVQGCKISLGLTAGNFVNGAGVLQSMTSVSFFPIVQVHLLDFSHLPCYLHDCLTVTSAGRNCISAVWEYKAFQIPKN